MASLGKQTTLSRLVVSSVVTVSMISDAADFSIITYYRMRPSSIFAFLLKYSWSDPGKWSLELKADD